MKGYIKNIVFLLILSIVSVMGSNVSARTVEVSTERELRNSVDGYDQSITEIKLASNITLTRRLEVMISDNNLTIDLAGHTLNAVNFNVDFIYSYSSKYYDKGILTLKDSSGTNEGKIITQRNLYFIAANMDNFAQEKRYGLVIDGGTYILTSSSSYSYLFGIFTNSYYTKGNNVTVDVTIKDGIFESTYGNQSIFSTLSPKSSDIKINFLIESMTLKGKNVRIDDESDIFGMKKISDVIADGTSVFYSLESGETAEVRDTTKTIGSLKGYGENGYIKFVKLHNLEVSDVLINETYGYSEPKEVEIAISSFGEDVTKIKNVTVDNSDFVIVSGNQTALNYGQIDKTWKIKAKSGLNAGNYYGNIIVTDENENVYTASVKLVVGKQIIDDLNVSMQNWIYGEKSSEPQVSSGFNLTEDMYTFKYAKKGSTSWNFSKPVNAGEYQVMVIVNSNNFSVQSAISDFKILPTEKIIKIVANSSTHQYDGNVYTDNGYKIYFDGKEVTNGKLLYDDVIENIKVDGSVIDVIDNTSNNNVINRNSIIITNKDNYKNIYYIDGTISIMPITTPIVVTANSDSKVYDGTNLTNNNYTYTNGILLAGDKLNVSILGSQKYVGTSINKIIKVEVLRNGKNITKNYTFATYVNGTLEVTEAMQIITLNENINVNIGDKLTIDQIKERLNCNITDYSIELVNGNAGIFNQIDGFIANSKGRVEMRVSAPAINVDGKGENEYAETTKTFYINVIYKEPVTISGLVDNEVFIYDGSAKKPSGIIKVEGNKVSIDDLKVRYVGLGYDKNTAPTEAGTYTVTYSVSSDNLNYSGSKTYTFTIKKAQLKKVTISNNRYEYNGSNITPTLNNVNKNVELSGNTKGKNVANYSMTITIKNPKNYEWNDGTNSPLNIAWSITKTTPNYTIPTGLIGGIGQKLSDISLTKYGKFTWNNPNEVLVSGKNKYKATFTPNDTINYKTIKDVDIEIYAKDIDNATINPDNYIYEVIEGANQNYTITKNKEAKFTINADYSKFIDSGKVYVDDALVDSKNYISESGSTIIKLKKEYVDTLSIGEHELKVEFSDGSAVTKFTITNVTIPVENQKTSNNLIIYVVGAFLGLSAVGLYVYRKKRKK